MSDYRLAFDSPAYLALAILAPLVWLWSFRSLSGLGPWRRVFALLLRSAVLLLLVAALAQMQLVQVSGRLAVMYLVDHSLSVSPEQSETVLRYVNQARSSQPDKKRRDMAGVIVFGRQAAVEIPPIDDNPPWTRVESSVDREATNLASAMKLAQACFPHDAAGRVVVIGDFNENIGDALEQGRLLADAGIGIDVVPLRARAAGEITVDKVAIPADVRQGQPFDLKIVVDNTGPDGAEAADASGRLQVVRKSGGREEHLLVPPNDRVTLPSGKRVFTVRETINAPDFYTYEARFIPDDPAADALPQNNTATAFTHVRGKGQVLLLVDYAADETPEAEAELEHYERLIAGLQEKKLEVTVRTARPEELFTDLSQLQPFDTVILGNVPRERFSDAQIEMLVRNTQNTGAGLVMLGGNNSFGAGGWSNTPLEEAMPVDFQIKATRVEAVGALAMLMHASELAQGNHWQKVIAREALKTLGPQDYCGILHYGAGDEWLWGQNRGGMLRVGPNRALMLAALDRMTPGDMPQFDPALKMAARSFSQLKDAAAKHMIIISDGDPSPPSGATMNALVKQGVKISTVAVGTHGAPGSQILQNIANAGKGKYYVVKDPANLPRIYQTEARRVAQPLILEKPEGIVPQAVATHEMIAGLADQFPPITGFVQTSKKDSRLVEVSVLSPVPAVKEQATILAGWTYGLGRAVAFTTDAGKRWATSWTQWEGYNKLFGQIVGWSMRPVDDLGHYTISTTSEDGKVKVVVGALGEEDEFLNFLSLGASVVGPDMKPIDLELKQTAPGRYVGEFPATDKGSYMVTISPGPGRAPVRSGVNISYSDEFRRRTTNEALFENLAGLKPKGGTAGKVIEAPPGTRADQLATAWLGVDSFRHDLAPATSSQDVWHLLLLAASCLFLADVFVRRVAISFAWAPAAAVRARDFVLRRQPAAKESPTIERLRSRKAEVNQQLAERRAAARFEPAPDAPASPDALRPDAGPSTRPPEPKPTGASLAPQGAPEAESYTERLLKAKQRVWEQREKPPE